MNNYKSKSNNPSLVVDRIIQIQTNNNIIKWDYGDDGILGTIHMNNLISRIKSSKYQNISDGYTENLYR